MGLKERLKIRIRLYLLALFTVPATLAHELAHGLVGLIFGARPQWGSLTLFPKISFEGTGYRVVFGSISFLNINSFNALPTALAPLLLLILPYWIINYGLENYTRLSIESIVGWLVISYLSVTLVLSSKPSSQDWHVAFSKPAGFIIYGCLAYFFIK